MRAFFSTLLILFVVIFSFSLEYGFEMWSDTRLFFDQNGLSNVIENRFSPTFVIGFPVGNFSAELGIRFPMKFVNAVEMSEFLGDFSAGLGASLRFWIGNLGVEGGAVYRIGKGILADFGLNLMMGNLLVDLGGVLSLEGESMKIGGFLGVGYGVAFFGSGCRSLSGRFILSKVEGIREGCGGKYLEVSRGYLEEIFKGLRIDVIGSNVELVTKDEVEVKSIGICMNGKKIVFRDGEPVEVRDGCGLSGDDLVLVYKGREYKVVPSKDFEELMESVDISEFIPDRDAKIYLARKFKIPILVMLAPENEINLIEGCRSPKISGRKLKCGGKEYDVLKVMEEVGVKLLGKSPVSGYFYVEFKPSGREAVAELRFEGVRMESGSVEASIGDVEILDDRSLRLVVPISWKDELMRGVELKFLPSAVPALSDYDTLGGKVFVGYNEEELTLRIKPLPFDMKSVERCYYEGLGSLRVKADFGFDEKELRVPVVDVKRGVLEVEYGGKRYRISGVKVVYERDLEKALRTVENTIVLVGEEFTKSVNVPNLDELMARSDGLKLEYRSGRMKLEGPNLREMGEYTLAIEKLKYAGCDLSEYLSGGDVSIAVLPNPSGMEVYGVVYRGVGDTGNLWIVDRVGNDIKGYVSIDVSTKAGALRIDHGVVSSYPSKSTVVKGEKRVKVKVDFAGRSFSEDYPVKFDVIVLPGKIENAGFSDGKGVFKRLVVGRNVGRLKLKLIMRGEDGSDISEFLDMPGIERELYGDSMTFSFKTHGESVQILNVSGVVGYRGSGEFEIDSMDGGDVVLDYNGFATTLEVLRLGEAKVGVNVSREFSKLDVEPVVPEGVKGCEFLILGPGNSIVKNVPVSEKAELYIPMFETVKAAIECEKASMVIPERLRENLKKFVVIRPPEVEFMGIDIKGEIEELPEKVIMAFPAVSISGKYTAYIKRNLETKETWLMIRDNETGDIREVFSGAVAGMEWHPMEDVLVFSGSAGGDYSIYIYVPETGDLRTLISESGKNLISPTFDYFGRKIAWVVEKVGVMVGDFSLNGVRNIVSTGERGIMPAISPDGESVVFEVEKRTYLWRNGKSKVINSDDFIEVDFSWSPDGKWIVFYQSTNYKKMFNLMGYNVETGETKLLYEGARREFGRVYWLNSDEFLFGSIGDYEISKFSLKEMRIVGGMEFEYPMDFIGEIVSTYNLGIFKSSEGDTLAILGGYLTTGTGQRDTVVWGYVR